MCIGLPVKANLQPSSLIGLFKKLILTVKAEKHKNKQAAQAATYMWKTTVT